MLVSYRRILTRPIPNTHALKAANERRPLRDNSGPTSDTEIGPVQEARSTHTEIGPVQEARSAHTGIGPVQEARSTHTEIGPVQEARSAHQGRHSLLDRGTFGRPRVC